MAQEKKKINQNVLFNKEYQKKRRKLKEVSEWYSPLADENGNLNGKNLAAMQVQQSIRKMELGKAKKQLAEDEFNGNGHALMMTDLRQETQEMEELLSRCESDRLVKVRGKMIPLRDFAAKQAFGLSQCATKAIYQFNSRKKSFKFKHSLRCGRRSCSVCAHFSSRDEGDLIVKELYSKLSELSEEEKVNGRLYHIVLTHENVELERAFEIFKVWRHTQKMKQKTYKTKKNEYEIWNILKWGMWRWEITRDEETGLYHPHLHIIAYVQGWLAPEAGGWWDQLVGSWISACDNSGLKASWEGQHFSVILYFKDFGNGDPRCLTTKFTAEDLSETVEGAVAEMAKYAVKSTDFTKLKRVKDGEDVGDIADEIALLFALMNGRKLKNGFGGFSLRDDEEPEEPVIEIEPDEEEEDPADLMEAIFKWDKREKRYRLMVLRNWDDQRFTDYLMDLQCYKDRHTLHMYYGLERESR